GLIPNLHVLVVGNMISKNEDRKAKEVKLLGEHVAAAADFWKPGPVRLVNSTLTDSGYYAKYQRDFTGKGQIQLPAVAVEDIRDEYGSLVKESETTEHALRKVTEERIHENRGVERVSS